MPDDTRRKFDVLKSRPIVHLVVTRDGMEHPGQVFNKHGAVIVVTGLEASTFMSRGWCELADGEPPL